MPIRPRTADDEVVPTFGILVLLPFCFGGGLIDCEGAPVELVGPPEVCGCRGAGFTLPSLLLSLGGKTARPRPRPRPSLIGSRGACGVVIAQTVRKMAAFLLNNVH